MFFCSIFFGLYAVSVKVFLRRVNPWLAFGVVAQLVSLGTIAGMGLRGDVGQIPRLGVQEWLLLALSSLLGIGLGHVLLYSSVRRLGATMSSAFQTVTPLVTFALAALLLGEAMTRQEWIAGAIMLAGALLLVLAEYRLHVRG
jgi:drug/metabolite transporter (DMT)-like permease